MKEEQIREASAEPVNESEKTPEEKRASHLKEIGSYILTMIVVVAVCLFINRFLFFRCVISGSSMVDSFYDGDNVICEMISYYFHAPKRFDVVILNLDENQKQRNGNEILIKRIIGLPGETVSASSGRIYINALSRYTSSFPEVTLGEDEYFVMGDNRDNSRDSRSFGAVKKSAIQGRVCFRFWPLSRVGSGWK